MEIVASLYFYIKIIINWLEITPKGAHTRTFNHKFFFLLIFTAAGLIPVVIAWYGINSVWSQMWILFGYVKADGLTVHCSKFELAYRCHMIPCQLGYTSFHVTRSQVEIGCHA